MVKFLRIEWKTSWQATPVDNAISQACQTMTQAKFVWFTTTVAAFAETSQKMQETYAGIGQVN